MPDTPQVLKLKVVLIGDEGVGKTSLVRRFVQSAFDDRYLRTVGVVIHKRIILQPVDGVPHVASLTVWDVIGRDDFVGRYREAYFLGTAGVLAVCDLTRPETLEGLGRWLERVRGVAGDVPAIVLANKRDLDAYMRLEESDLLAFCEVSGLPYLETSAKTGENVDVAFGKLAEMGIRRAIARSPARPTEVRPLEQRSP